MTTPNTETRVIVIMPAYMAEKTLEKTCQSLPPIYYEIILCDDGSSDKTADISRRLNLTTIVHPTNKGYGANQKTLYAYALKQKADIIAMVHPDNQYDTSCIPEMIQLIKNNACDLILGTRMQTARINGMPWWKRYGNIFLTTIQNFIFKTHLSEFHSGLRVFRASLISNMPYCHFSDDFVFDSECIAWTIANKYRISEIPTQCFYGYDVSSINFKRSVTYGFATLTTLLQYVIGKYGTPTICSVKQKK